MKKFLLILVCLLMLPGCGREETAEPTPPPTTQPTAAPAAAESTLCGVVYELTGDSMVLQCDSGGLYAFPLSEDAGLVPGQRLTLRCAGALDAQSLWQSAAILELCPEPVTTPAASGVYTLRGTVQDATTYTLTVLGEDGHLYSFPQDPARCFAPNGILPGYTAEVDCDAPPNPAEVWQMVTVLQMRVTASGTDGSAALSDAAAARRAAELLAGMTLEERVGQVFLGRFPLQAAAENAARWHLGGYVLYAENAAGKTPGVLRSEIEAVQAAAKLPLIMAVDEEGGTVNRLSAYTAFRALPFPSPMSLYHEGGWFSVNADTAEKAALLHSVGINVNLAPVADVCGSGSYMYSRSFGGDAFLTAQYVDEVVRGYTSAGMGCVLKHFPGYGDNVDTHTGSARDNRSLTELRNRDLLPFASGIDAGVGCILMSHNIVAAFDPGLPASLSPAAYAYLRESMGFAGVTMTDDLAMSAIRAHAGGENPAVQALRAGCDLICSASCEEEIAAVLAALRSGSLSETRLNEAVERVLVWKLKLGIIV